MKRYLFIATIIVLASPLIAQKRILAEDANKHVGENVIVTGKITGSKVADKMKKPATILNMGTSTVNFLAIVINMEDRKNFPYNPEDYLSNKKVSVTGKVTELYGHTEIIINGPEDIKIEETQQGGGFKPLEFDGFNRYFQDEK